jgi:hypothetical protein
VAQAADAWVTGALCLGNLAWIANERQDLDLAQEHLDAAMVLAVRAREQLSDPIDGIYEVQLLLVQADLHRRRDDPSAHRAAIDRALALSSALDAPRLRCSCLEYAAIAARMHADEALATRHIDAAEGLAAEFGLPLYQAAAQGQRARLHLQCGRWDEAARASAVATQMYSAMGHVAGAATNRAISAEAAWRGGRAEEAVALWEENAAAQTALGQEVAARCTRLRLAEARAASGLPDDVQAALQAVRAELPAMTQAGALSAGEFPLATRLAAWRLLHGAGDAQAPAQLALAEAELQQVLDGFADPEVRARVAQAMPWHRDVLEAVAAQDPDGGVHSAAAAGPAAPGP